MTTIRKIMEYTRKIAPYELADEWDNIGLLVGTEDAVIGKALLTLDITPETAEEAKLVIRSRRFSLLPPVARTASTNS